jgi:WhiB family transcriptional regulator, redox-sensing transcriptional regulator
MRGWLLSGTGGPLPPAGRPTPNCSSPISAFGQALGQVAEAKAICARYPVRRQCLAFALRTRQAHGIGGGLTEEERASVRRPRSRPA